MSCLRGWPAETVVLLIGTAQPPLGRQRRKKEWITKRRKYISYLHCAFPYFPGTKIHLSICWPKEGSIWSTTSRFAAFAAPMVLVMLAAVNWYLLKPPGSDTNYFFVENFRVKYSLTLHAFYEEKKKKGGLYTGYRHVWWLTLKFIREIWGIRTPFPTDTSIGVFQLFWLCHTLFLLPELCSTMSPPPWHHLRKTPVPTSPQTCLAPCSWSPSGKGETQICDFLWGCGAKAARGGAPSRMASLASSRFTNFSRGWARLLKAQGRHR